MKALTALFALTLPLSAQYYKAAASRDYLCIQTNPAAAYAVGAVISPIYKTKCVEVRDSGGQTATTFYSAAAVADGRLTAAIGGTDNGLVRTWYDGSRNGNNATQTTDANQPTLVNAGTLVTENSVATLDFDGANDAFITSATGIISGTSSRSSFTVVEADVDNSLDYLYSLSDSGASGSQWLATTEPGVRCNNQIRIWDGDNITTPLRMHTITFPAVGNAADIDLWVDGTLATETSLTDGGIDTSTAQPLKVGGNSTNGRVLDGRMSCLVLYASDQTANRSTIESILNSIYSVY